MKRSKKISLIVAVLVFSLAFMGTGFAMWSQDIKINGTVNAEGKIELQVTGMKMLDSAALEEIEYVSGALTEEAFEEGSDVTFAALGNSYTISGDQIKLAFPGDVKVVRVYLENSGNVDVNVTETSLSYTSAFATGKIANADILGLEIPVDGEAYFDIVFRANTNWNTNTVTNTVSATVTIDFQQEEATPPSASHE